MQMRTFQSEVMATNNEYVSSMFMLTFVVVMDPTMVTVLMLDTMVMVMVMVVSTAKM
jgi:hypothetical protein